MSYLCYFDLGDYVIEFKWNDVLFEITNIGGGKLEENISKHSHALNSFELHFITGGKGRLIADGNKFDIEKGDFFITGPNICHEQFTDENENTEDVFVTVQAKNPKKANRISRLFLNTPFFYTKGFNNDTAKEMLKEYREKKTDYQSCVSALCKKLMTEIIREIADGDEYHEDSIQNLNDRRFIIIEKAFLYEKDLTLSSLAEKIGLCERQTQRLLKKYYSKTFREKMRERNSVEN